MYREASLDPENVPESSNSRVVAAIIKTCLKQYVTYKDGKLKIIN